MNQITLTPEELLDLARHSEGRGFKFGVAATVVTMFVVNKKIKPALKSGYHNLVGR